MKQPPKTILYKDLYEVRILSSQDGKTIFEAANESLPALQRFMSWAHIKGNVDDACKIYGIFEAKTLKGEEAHFAGFDAKTGEFLFCASLVPGSRLNSAALDVGYWVTSKRAGQGIGTIAAKILIYLAFSYYEADRLSLVCNPENNGSLRIAEKCGFRFEGTLRNYLVNPSPKMLSNGYSAIRDVSCFSIIPEDLAQLGWLSDFHYGLTIESPQAIS